MKHYVLDTCVLLEDPLAWQHYIEKGIVHIPYPVLLELESKKKDPGAVGANSREFGRLFASGVIKEAGIVTTGEWVKGDRAIIDYCVKLNASQEVTAVCLDNFFVGFAKAEGVKTEIYLNANPKEKWVGYSTYEVETDLIDAFYSLKGLKLKDVTDKNLYPNEFFILKAGTKSALAKRKGDQIVPLHYSNYKPLNKVSAQNAEQKFMMELLFDPHIPTIAISGTSGSGKTLLSSTAALHQVESGLYRTLQVGRETVSLGEEIGFLPGDINEKISPWGGGVLGAINDIAFHSNDGQEFKKDGEELEPLKLTDFYIGRSMLALMPVCYLRGVTWNHKITILDEAQNSKLGTLKSVATRVGKGSKVIFLGDVDQIDADYLTKDTNGLTQLIHYMKSSPTFAHIHLKQSLRSDAAAAAATLIP